jgi:thiol-disulfide isomerase/thioredoxin
LSKESKIVFAVIIIACLMFILIYSLNKTNENMKTVNQIVDTVLNADTETMLYVGSSECEACDLQGAQMSLLLENYDFQYYYVDFNEIPTTSAKTKFIKDIGVDTSEDFSTPTILIYKDGKIISQTSGLTSINKIFTTLQKNSIISSEDSLPVNYLSLPSFIDLTEDNAKQVVVLGSAAEVDSNSAQEIIWDIAKENNIKINYLMTNDLSEKEGATFEKTLDFYAVDDNPVTTPSMLIIENGQVTNFISDLQDSDTYVNFLKENGIIE